MNQGKGDSPTPRESIMAMRKGGGNGIGKNRSEEYVLLFPNFVTSHFPIYLGMKLN